MQELILTMFFKHQLQLKMYHFQTKLYGAHKASDAYLITFAVNLDKFMEVSQGIHGNLTMKQLTLDFPIATDETIIAEISTFSSLLRKLDLSESSELANIRDGMVADAEQLKYLLTFK